MPEEFAAHSFTILLERLESQLGLLAEGHGSILRSLHEQRQEYLQHFAELRSDMMANSDDIRGKLDGLAEDVADLKTDVADLKTDVADLKTKVDRLEHGQEELRSEVRAGFDRLDKHEGRIAAVERAG